MPIPEPIDLNIGNICEGAVPELFDREIREILENIAVTASRGAAPTKTFMTKAHLLDSAEPLVAGKDYEALCGKQIAKAYFGFFFDTELTGATINALRCCMKCRDGQRGLRYLYGIIDGQESRQAEEES